MSKRKKPDNQGVISPAEIQQPTLVPSSREPAAKKSRFVDCTGTPEDVPLLVRLQFNGDGSVFRVEFRQLDSGMKELAVERIVPGLWEISLAGNSERGQVFLLAMLYALGLNEEGVASQFQSHRGQDIRATLDRNHLRNVLEELREAGIEINEAKQLAADIELLVRAGSGKKGGDK